MPHRSTTDDVKPKIKLFLEFILPLLNQRSGRDDQAALQIPTQHQLFDEQTSHDCLAGAGVICEQEPQGLPGQHIAIHGGDLVGERLNR